jgi:hypothetical protein
MKSRDDSCVTRFTSVDKRAAAAAIQLALLCLAFMGPAVVTRCDGAMVRERSLIRLNSPKL